MIIFTENDMDRIIQINYDEIYQTPEKLKSNDESSQNELDKLSFNE